MKPEGNPSESEQFQEQGSLKLNLETPEDFESITSLELDPPEEAISIHEAIDAEGQKQEIRYLQNSLVYPLPLEGKIELADRLNLHPLRDKAATIAEKYFSKTSNIREFHSRFGVDNVLVALAREQGLSDEEIMIVSTTAQLHDIGRVVMEQERVKGTYEGIDGRQFTILNSRQHPNISAKYMLNENLFDDPEHSWGDHLSDKQRKDLMAAIFNAVLYHGDRELPDEYEGIEVLKMLKDADKIENLYQMAHVLDKNVFFDERITGSFVGRLTQDKVISPATLDQFLRGEQIDVRNMETRIDNLVGHLAWHGHLSNSAALELALKSNYDSKAIKFIQHNVSQGEGEIIENKFSEIIESTN